MSHSASACVIKPEIRILNLMRLSVKMRMNILISATDVTPDEFLVQMKENIMFLDMIKSMKRDLED